MINALFFALTTVLCIQSSDVIKTWEDQLFFQLEVEKVGRDYYSTMYEKWDLLAFRNLSKSEERHMECIQLLLKEYNLDLASLDKKSEFTHEELGSLYADLLNSGNESVNQAIKAGAYLEERNIQNLKLLIKSSEDEETTDALNNLYENSKCHLGLMVCLLKHRNVDYRPVILTVNEFLDCDRIKSMIGSEEADCPFNEYNCPFKDQL